MIMGNIKIITENFMKLMASPKKFWRFMVFILVTALASGIIGGVYLLLKDVLR